MADSHRAGRHPDPDNRPTRYTISGFDTGSGGIAVHGDELDLLARNLCNGVGHYRWSIDGDELRLEPIGPDQCPGRALALRDRTYARLQ
jgi:hypothetical protein